MLTGTRSMRTYTPDASYSACPEQRWLNRQLPTVALQVPVGLISAAFALMCIGTDNFKTASKVGAMHERWRATQSLSSGSFVQKSSNLEGFPQSRRQVSQIR